LKFAEQISSFVEKRIWWSAEGWQKHANCYSLTNAMLFSFWRSNGRYLPLCIMGLTAQAPNEAMENRQKVIRTIHDTNMIMMILKHLLVEEPPV